MKKLISSRKTTLLIFCLLLTGILSLFCYVPSLADEPSTDLSFGWSYTGRMNLGESQSFSPQLQNRGQNTASNINVVLYVNDQEMHRWNVPTLAAGANTVLRPSYSFAPRQAGNYRVRVTIDPDNRISDTDRANNTRTAEIAVTEPSKPDLSLGWSYKKTMKAGKSQSFTPQLQNRGEGDASNIVVVLYVNNRESHRWNVPLLKAGKSSILQPSYRWVPRKKGSYIIKIEVDPNNSISETNEKNNGVKGLIKVL
ncbi:MAG: CARDB domain-containing protein [Armatimonadota bacterium]